MTGSEGLLGIVVEVTVKLLVKPERAQVVLAAFDSVESAGAAVARIIGAGILPAGLEMMDNLSIRAAEDFVHAGYPGGCRRHPVMRTGRRQRRSVGTDHGRAPSACMEAGATEVRTAQKTRPSA
jgi:glycolate oxidase